MSGWMSTRDDLGGGAGCRGPAGDAIAFSRRTRRAILDFLQGLRGTLHVTFEEGTHSAWLYDLLVRRVARWWCAIRAKMRC